MATRGYEQCYEQGNYNARTHYISAQFDAEEEEVEEEEEEEEEDMRG